MKNRADAIEKSQAVERIWPPPYRGIRGGLSLHFKKPMRQILLATLLVMFGVILITGGFFAPPTGVIDASVLTAFGEILTFAGALFGIDAKYKSKLT